MSAEVSEVVGRASFVRITREEPGLHQELWCCDGGPWEGYVLASAIFPPVPLPRGFTAWPQIVEVMLFAADENGAHTGAREHAAFRGIREPIEAFRRSGYQIEQIEQVSP